MLEPLPYDPAQICYKSPDLCTFVALNLSTPLTMDIVIPTTKTLEKNGLGKLILYLPIHPHLDKLTTSSI